MDKRVYAGISVILFAVLVISMTSYNASAHYRKNQNKEGQLEIVANALGTDIDSLKRSLSEGQNMRDLINQSGIDREDLHDVMQEAHLNRLNELVANGEITQERADEIINRMAEHEAIHEEMRERRNAVQVSIEANDYESFVFATEGIPFFDQITEEEFPTLVEAHNLRESGDYAGAKDLMQSMGALKPLKLEFQRGHGKMFQAR